ncbi:MAG: T9SS type A sorting domain-containing protein [Bacteroidia bacterium]
MGICSIQPAKFLLKALSLAALLTGSVQGVMAQAPGLVWQAPIQVANGSVYDNIRPQIAVTSGNVPLVLWCKSTGGKNGYVARWNGSAFDTPFKINPSGSINSYTVEGPNIAAKGDTIFIAYTTYPPSSAQVMVRSSFDAGLNWSNPIWVDSLNPDMPTFGNVAILPGGNPIVNYIRQTTAYLSPRWVARASSDGGMTWAPEAVSSAAAPGTDVCDCCTGHLYSHQGKVISVFRNNDANLRDFWATVSTDGGQTFGTAIDLDTTDWTLAACPSSGAGSAIVGDSIYSVFMSQGTDALARVWIGAASLNGSTTAYNLRLNGNVAQGTIQNYPVIAASGDTIVAAWMESTSSNPEIMLRYSFHGIAGLFANPVVNVTEMAAGVQSFPDLKWANGELHLVWQDDAANQVRYRKATVGIPAGNHAQIPLGWRVFPNPTNGRLSLGDLPAAGGELLVLNANGQLVFRRSLLDGRPIELDLSALPAGTYFLKLRSTGMDLGTRRISKVD